MDTTLQRQRTNQTTASSTCEWCGGTGWLVYFAPDAKTDPTPIRNADVIRFRWDHPRWIESLAYCPCFASAIKQRRIDNMLGDPDIPRDSLRFDFADFQDDDHREAVTLARQLVDGIAINTAGEEKPGVLFVGPTGTGKTTLAAIVFRHWAERGASCVWTDYTGFIKRIQESYNQEYQGPTRQQMITLTAEAAYMVLDDLGAKIPGKNSVAPASADKVEIVYQVLSIREKRRLPTIITSNLDKDELYAHFEARIVSRIRGLCHGVYIGGQDFRAPGDR